MPARPRRAERRQARQIALLRQLKIVDQGAGGGHLGPFESTETVERADLELSFQSAAAIFTVEAGARQGRDDIAPIAQGDRQIGALLNRLGDQDFAGLETRKDTGDGRCGDRFKLKIAGRHIDPSGAQPVADGGQGHQEIMAAAIEQAVLGQGAGGDDAHHLAPDHRLGPAFFSRRRVLGLFANGDAKALPDEPRQIGFGGVVGHPAHRNIAALDPATAGQGDSTRIGRRPCSSGEHARRAGLGEVEGARGDEQPMTDLDRPPCLRGDRGALDQRQQVALHALAADIGDMESAEAILRAVILSISSRKTMPFFSTASIASRPHDVVLVEQLVGLFRQGSA